MFKYWYIAAVLLGSMLTSCATTTPIHISQFTNYNLNLSIEKNISGDSLISLITYPKGMLEFYDQERCVKVFIYTNANIRNYSILPTLYLRRISMRSEYDAYLKDQSIFLYDYYSDYYFVFFNDKLTYWGTISDFKRNSNPQIKNLAKLILDNYRISFF